MIKKELKPFCFIECGEFSIFDGFNNAGHVLVAGDGGLTWTAPVLNEWRVHLDTAVNVDPQFVLEANGDAILTGRMHALGTVIYDTTEQRLKFWDGNSWLNIN
jgi:hypothetical protein